MLSRIVDLRVNCNPREIMMEIREIKWDSRENNCNSCEIMGLSLFDEPYTPIAL